MAMAGEVDATVWRVSSFDEQVALTLAAGKTLARRVVVVPTRLLPRRTTGRVEPD